MHTYIQTVRQTDIQTDKQIDTRQTVGDKHLRQSLYTTPWVDRQATGLLDMRFLNVANTISNHLQANEAAQHRRKKNRREQGYVMVQRWHTSDLHK